MEALVPAFIVTIVAQLGEKPAWLTAILADRFGQPIRVALAAILAHAGLNAMAAIGAGLIGPTLSPNAQALFLAVAFLFGGLGTLMPMKAPDRLTGWKISATTTTALGTFSMALGSQTQFFALAFGVFGLPWFAFAGSTAGAACIAAVAALMGETFWTRLPMRALRLASATVFLATAAVIGAGALRLI
jgi:putative Ca2+/H+ antiporter (TMEM165/GDT1 family)